MFYVQDLICAGGKLHKKYEHPARPRPFSPLAVPALRPGRVLNKANIYLYNLVHQRASSVLKQVHLNLTALAL